MDNVSVLFRAHGLRIPRRTRGIRLRAPIRPMTEKRWQAQVIRLARFMGWHVQYLTDARGSGWLGWPDLFLVRRGRAIAAELKLDHEEPRPEQWECLAQLAAVPGITAVCWRPRDLDQVIKVLA